MGFIIYFCHSSVQIHASVWDIEVNDFAYILEALHNNSIYKSVLHLCCSYFIIIISEISLKLGFINQFLYSAITNQGLICSKKKKKKKTVNRCYWKQQMLINMYQKLTSFQANN